MNIQPPAFVTFTGIDEWTDTARIRDLSDRYPVEWGILFSPRLQGDHPRYPSVAAVERTVRALGGRVGLAAHLCGGHAATVLATARCPDLEGVLAAGFGRFQVNTADPAADPGIVAGFAMHAGGTGIMQCRTPPPHSFPYEDRVAWLYDASGGRGATPAAWPEPPAGSKLVGYAGGLGPDTVAAALSVIGAGRLPGQPYWIDMETNVRTDERLDLDRCEAVLRAAYGER